MGVFHSIRIIGDPDGIGKHILIDGEELRGVISATVCYAVDHPPRVFLEIVTQDVEIDDPEVEIVKDVHQSEKE